ncbi:DUF5476 family protein [Yersinia pestis]|uniref:Gp6.7 n=2 Tax=Berlinvirus Yepf TaxID=2732789 RepID=E5L7E3_9CAUD|nr:DUF5476 family protein [Yersinia pestis]YP_009014848.1 DUF5476 family protein [Yersinia phage Yep-phi]QTI27934.1 hypothetical protein [Yersinia phage vB_YpP-YepMm]ADQ83181.1 hypothetical protein YEP_phi_CDS00027 [Yersinia phage Yep-phi]MBD3443819.1 DUF5476 family protein [Yersinia pestis]MBD3447773.1 DUF5476 family protein [Yersinia pestis]MBD3451701.1 DUF5476 family protein [Yersinia pestis]
MCFSPKIKVPQVDTNQVRAIDPAPLTEKPKGVLFGGDDTDAPKDGTSSEVSTGGRKSLKVKLEDTPSKTMKDDKTKRRTGTKASIRKSVFNNK